MQHGRSIRVCVQCHADPSEISAAAKAAESFLQYASDPSSTDRPGLEQTKVKQGIVWPLRCACCCEPVDGSVRLRSVGEAISATSQVITSRAWDIPYCAACLKHVETCPNERAEKAEGIVIAIGAAALAVYFGYIGGTRVNLISSLVAIALVLLSIFAVKYAVNTKARVNKFREKCIKKTCATTSAAAQYEGSEVEWQQGWPDITYRFLFHNEQYADEFVKANHWGIRKCELQP